MKGLPFVLLFTAMTFVAWGAYGPTLHHGADGLNHDSMRAFVGVGLAYFLIAVIFPIVIMRTIGENGKWTISGAIYSLVAGAVGAVGALGIILALGYGGQTLYVMPLVFGFAPVVNTLVTALLSRTFNQISPIFIGGILTAALGAGGVLYFKPGPVKPAASSSEHSEAEDQGRAEHQERVASSEATNPGRKRGPGASSVEAPTLDLGPIRMADGTQAETSAAETATETPATETPATETETPAKPLVSANVPEAAEPPAPKLESSSSAEPTPAAEPSTTVEPEVAGDAVPEVGLPPEVVQPPQPNQSAALSDATVDTIPAGRLALWSDGAAASDEVSEAGESEAGESESKSGDAQPVKKKVDGWMVAFSIVIAALCWGSYGPMLHIGQAKMGGSRLRPFTCVGLAYFFIAVAAPLYVISQRAADTGSWTAGGMTWSFLAGVAGAIGALGVVLAFNAGGKPYYVMPLIFGFAPVINTFISLTEAGSWDRTSPMFWISLAVVIAGAITVLTNAPKPKPKPAPATGA